MHRYAFHGMLTGGAAAIALISASVIVPAQTAPAQHDAGCTQLSSLKITASEIGLPTSGATIASAQIATVPTDPADPAAGTRKYCKVLGAIAPVDRNAPPINFQVNLPVQWNGKAVQYGGGGSNGVLITGLNALRDARRETPVPVARGFATWGTDAGHQNEALSEPFAFALNEEALVNMAYASYKKTRDVARRVAEAFYGRVPSRTYFFGGSSGGREGLMMAQRFPDDFDGIVSVVPVVHYTGLTLVKARLAPLQRAGGWMNTAKVKLVHRAVNAACDGLDNLADGIIGAYEQCRFGVASLRCEKGTDAGDDCLSDAQIEADTLLRRPFKYPFPLAHGVTAFPGWSYGSEDQPGGMAAMVSGSEPPTFPIKNARAQSVFWIFGDPTIRYLFARDASFNPLTFIPETFARRVREISDLYDTTNPDLSAFHKSGGKLILKGNAADYQVGGLQAVSYYKSVVAKMGQARADSFIRFYVTPGVNHGGEGKQADGRPVPSDVDLLGALDGWADKAHAPGVLTQVTQEAQTPFKVIATRPMCLYPTYPQYNGSGDPNSESSFTCARQ